MPLSVTVGPAVGPRPYTGPHSRLHPGRHPVVHPVVHPVTHPGPHSGIHSRPCAPGLNILPHHSRPCRPVVIPPAPVHRPLFGRPIFTPPFFSRFFAPCPPAPPVIIATPAPRIHVVDRVGSAIGGVALAIILAVPSTLGLIVGVITIDPPVIVLSSVGVLLSAAIGIPSARILLKG